MGCGDCFVHPSAVVSPDADLGRGGHVGPYCIVGPHVKLGDNCVLHSHVVIEGDTQIGDGNQFFPFSVIGLPPQDLKHKGELTKLEIGDYNVFREHVSIHTGTVVDKGVTIIGNHCNFLLGSHLGHDCKVGNGVVLSASALVAGHCIIDDEAIISAICGIVQHIQIGSGAFVEACSKVIRHLPPFMLMGGAPSDAKLGINLVGLRRRGTDPAVISELQRIFKILFVERDGVLASRLEKARSTALLQVPEVKIFFDFLDRVKARKLPGLID